MRSAAKNLNKQKLMVGTGSPSLEETITLTKFADDLGYKVALVLPPFYYKPFLKYERVLEAYLVYAHRVISSFLKAISLLIKKNMN